MVKLNQHNLVPFPSKPNMHQSLLFASAAPLNQSEDTADTLSTNQNEMALRKLNFDAIHRGDSTRGGNIW